MSRLAPLPMKEITDPELRDLITRCEELGVPDPLFPRIIARVPGQAKAVLRALLMGHAEGSVDHRLKELMRIQLARFVEDPYFSELRSKRAQADGMTEDMVDSATDDYEDSELFTVAEKIALRYSDQLFLDATKVDKFFYDEMRKHYSEPQIMEIGSFVALYHAIQLFMKTLDARPLAAA